MSDSRLDLQIATQRADMFSGASTFKVELDEVSSYLNDNPLPS